MNQSILRQAVLVLLLICGLAVITIGGVGALAADASADSQGGLLDIDHDESVDADGELEVTVATERSAGTVVEFEFEESDVTLASGDAVAIDDNRVEFLDPDAADSTHTIHVELDEGSPGETGVITAWVNAEDADDAEDAEDSTFRIEEPEETESEDGTVSLTHPEEVQPDNLLEVTVNTTDSAGSVVEIDSDELEAEIDSDDAVVVDNGRVEFLDPGANDSSYTVEIDIIGGDSGDSGKITAWVNSEIQGDADDVATGTINLVTDDEDESSPGNNAGSDETGSGNDTLNGDSDGDESTNEVNKTEPETDSINGVSDSDESTNEVSEGAETDDGESAQNETEVNGEDDVSADQDSTADSLPGFGIPGAVISLFGGGYLLNRKRE